MPKKMSDEELIARLNSLEKRIFALQRDLPQILLTVIRQYLLHLVKEADKYHV